jgi:hypothetical protein
MLTMVVFLFKIAKNVEITIKLLIFATRINKNFTRI